MRIDPAYLDAETAYRLITGVVVPRPIAWVTSLSATGVLNLAPFSAFTFVSPKPPMLAIASAARAESTRIPRRTSSTTRSMSFTSRIRA